MLASDKDNPDISTAIAEELAKMWEVSKQDLFAQYMRENYRIGAGPKPEWTKLIIAEAREGNFEELHFPSPLLKRYWVVDALGITQAANPRFEDRVCGIFYEMPAIRFFTDSDYLLVSERLGPNLLFRRLIGCRSRMENWSLESLSRRGISIKQEPERNLRDVVTCEAGSHNP